MKNIAYLTFLIFICSLVACQPETDTSRFLIKPSIREKAIPFDLDEVKLLESPFKKAQELDGKWLLSLEPDRFLHRFLKNAGLTPKAPVYGGWESLGVGGHSLGHYLSACAMMYNATGDTTFLARTNYMVSELYRCQKARGTGYVGSIENEDSIWAQVSKGNIRSDGFDLNGGWVPLYVLHKLWNGLTDVYVYTGNEQAKEIVVKLSDWAYDIFHTLTTKQWQKVLACEHGGMLEALTNVYALTGNKKYLEMSYWFNHQKVFGPWLLQKDSLAGLHANTQVPKAVGLARRYALTGNKDDKTMSHFFWNTVTAHHTYCIGGNSDGEHFGEPCRLSNRLSDRTTETCNTHNMLKLTKLLFAETADSRYADYYEKALYNHILASQNPETGMVTYYVPLGAGCRRGYSSRDETFTCCVGTGFENHARYGEAIYFKSADHGIYINLYIPSRLDWKEKGITVTQQNNYPVDGNLLFSVRSEHSRKFPIYLRYPAWATQGVTLSVNNKNIPVTSRPDSYIKISRKWADNDRIELKINMPLYLDPMSDNPNRAAIKYGPIVLAGRLGQGALNPVRDIPVLVTNEKPVKDWLVPKSKDSCLFTTRRVGKLHDITLAPFYSVYNERYIVYFDFFNDSTWRKKEAAYKEYLVSQERLKQQTIDFVQLGEMQPERDHSLKGEATDIGELHGRKFRLCWNNGWLSFKMRVDPAVQNQLVCTYWGSDGTSNAFDILIDEQPVANVVLNAPSPEEFYDVSYNIPESFIKGKQEVKVTFRSHRDKMVGRLFGCRIIDKNK